MTTATARLAETTEAALDLYSRLLADGPVECHVVGRRAEGLGIPKGCQAQARRLLGVETFRGAGGEPFYRLPRAPT